MKKSIIKLLTVSMMATMVAGTVISCSSDDDNGGTEVTNPSDFVVNRDNLQGEITKGEVVLESGTYKLTGQLFVREGATLRIKPGVVIEATAVADPNDFASVRFITVAQGGKIYVEGTKESPVVMTTTNKVPGSWGGLVICGRAPINKGNSATAEVGGDVSYGGTDSNDNSGSIEYLRIEYAGFGYSIEKEFNGLSLFGVGKGTKIQYVQAHESSDDGFEWFGGTVDSRYLVVTNANSAKEGDDMFDWTEGWNGIGEYWYGKKTNIGNRGIEADNNSLNHLANPISNPTLRNITLIGAGDQGAEPQALKLRVGTQGTLDNVVLSNWKVGFDIQHDESVSYVGNQLKATNVHFDNVATKSVGKNTAGETVDVSKVYTESANANGAGAGTATPEWAKGWTVGL